MTESEVARAEADQADPDRGADLRHGRVRAPHVRLAP